jgi:hypothetical protein
LNLRHYGRVCDRGPGARLRSRGAGRCVCEGGRQWSSAPSNQIRPLRPAPEIRRKRLFPGSTARWSAGGLAGALEARSPHLRSPPPSSSPPQATALTAARAHGAALTGHGQDGVAHAHAGHGLDDDGTTEAMSPRHWHRTAMVGRRSLPRAPLRRRRLRGPRRRHRRGQELATCSPWCAAMAGARPALHYPAAICARGRSSSPRCDAMAGAHPALHYTAVVCTRGRSSSPRAMAMSELALVARRAPSAR